MSATKDDVWGAGWGKRCLEEDMTGFGIKFEGWRKAAQKAGKEFRRVEDGAAAFIRKWLDAASFRAAERHAKAVAMPPTVGISTRREGGVGYVVVLTSPACCVVPRMPFMHLLPFNVRSVISITF